MNSHIIIALDGLSKSESLALAESVSGMAWGFKAHELLIREGFQLISELKKYGNVFADLKFHDIPETVRKEVAALTELGADLISIHASGGRAMLEAAVAVGGEKIVAITVLTSLSPEENVMIYHNVLTEQVKNLAKLAHDAGVKNIVCSPHDISIVRKATPEARIITPGIRGVNDAPHDQKRTMTAREALDAGADFLVIGRPITKAPDPRQALGQILNTLS